MLARCASISLARPVSIISAPAPTVTITAAGTPIRATCQERRRRAPASRRVPGRGAAGQVVRPGGGLAHRPLPRAEQLVWLAERRRGGLERRTQRACCGALSGA